MTINTSQSATSVITNSASAQCFSSTFSTTRPDYRMHVLVYKVCFCIFYVQTIYYQTLSPIPIKMKIILPIVSNVLLKLIQAVFAC